MATIDRRVEELEVRLAFLARDLEALDGVVRESADALRAVERALQEIRDASSGVSERASDSVELPPHHGRW